MNATQALTDAISTALAANYPTTEQIDMWRAALDDATTPQARKAPKTKTHKTTDYPAIMAKIKGPKNITSLADMHADGTHLTRYTEDLDTISTPSTMPPGIYRMIGKELTRIGDPLAPDLLPPVPAMQGDIVAIDILSDNLRDALVAVQAAQSEEETRLVLNSVLLKASENSLTAVATDGHRLHNTTTNCSASGTTEIIIPYAVVAHLLKLLPDTPAPTTLNQAGTNLRIRCGDSWHASFRLITGPYPNYQLVIPPPAENPIKIYPTDWLKACQEILDLETQRLKTSGATRTNPQVCLAVKFGTLSLSSFKYDPTDPIPAKTFHMGIFPAIPPRTLNAQFLLDIIRQCGDDTAWLHDSGPHAPLMFTAGQFTAVILPLRAN